MFCSKCGSNLPDGSLFCAACGTPTNTESTAQQQYEQPDHTAQQQYAQPDYTAQQQYEQPDYTAQQQYAQPDYTAQQQYTQQFSTMPTAPKKKSKKGLIIGLSCGGAAAVTAGVLTLTLAQSAIMRSVMGDTEYAKSVNTRFLTSEFSQYSDVARSAVHNSSKALGSVKSIAAGTASLSRLSYGSRSANDYFMEVYDDDNRLYDLYDKYDSTSIQAASTLYMLADVIDVMSKDGLTVSVGMKAELGESLLELIPDSYKDIVDDVKDIISSSEIKICAEKKDGALGYSLYLTRNGDNFIGAVIRITKDGDITIALPEATKRAIGFKIPSAEELGVSDAFLTDTEPLLSEKDIERLTEEITKAYLSCYENADISYDDGSVVIDGNETKCTVITTTFDAEDIGNIIGKVADVIANDESAKKISDELGGAEYLDELIESMHSAEYSIKQYNTDAKLVVESYVNSANQPLGVKFSLGNDYQEYTFISLDNGSYGRTALEMNGSTLIELVDRKDSSSSGKAVLSVYPYAGSYYGDSSQSISINIDYKDRGTFKAFGQENMGGTYTISIVDSEMMKEAFSSLSYSGFDVYEIIKGLSLTISANEYKGGIEESLGVTVEKYGSASITARAVPDTDIPSLPGDLIMITQDSENANDEINALTQDVFTFIKNKFTSDGQLKKLDEDFEKIFGQKISTAFDSVLTGYTAQSKVTSADSTAASIKDCINVFLTNADTAGYGMKRDSYARVTCIIDGSGRFEMMLSDTSGLRNNSSISWERVGSAYPSESKVGETNATRLLAIEFGNLFPDLKNACFEAQLSGGRCTAVWFAPDCESPYLISDFADGGLFTNDGWINDYGFSYPWDGNTAGVTASGHIVGTAPKLPLG